ncbi:MAG: hypothetical protein ACODAD_16370, partial [Planctomycetota bacterium]
MIDRTIAWFMPGVLLFMGCGTPYLVQPTPPVRQAAADEARGKDVETASGTRPESEAPANELSRLVQDEAALIRQTALKAGYSPLEARQMEQSVINAQSEDRDFLTRLIYAHLHRCQAATSEPDARISTNSPSSPAGSPEFSEPSPRSAHMVAPATADLFAETPVRPASHTRRADPGVRGPGRGATLSPKTSSSSVADPADLPRRSGATDAEYSEQAPVLTGESSADSQQTGKGASGTSKVGTEEGGNANVTEMSAAGETLKPADTDNATGEETEKSSQPDQPISWQQSVDRAIGALRRKLQTDEQLESLEETRLRASLGLLQLVAQDPEKAMATLEGLNDQQLEFWRQTMMGLDVLMDVDGWPKMRYRVEAASDHLQRGLSALKTLGPLQVNNLAFVNDVRSFGDYDEIGARGFDPGEHLILYVEIGNFTVEETTYEETDQTSSSAGLKTSPRIPMYETELVGRYDILNQEERIVMSRTLPVVRDRCRHHRGDFFVPYELHLPRQVDAGYYRLELTIEDRKGSKYG